MAGDASGKEHAHGEDSSEVEEAAEDHARSFCGWRKRVNDAVDRSGQGERSDEAPPRCRLAICAPGERRPACACGHGSATKILRRMKIVGLPFVGTLKRCAGGMAVFVSGFHGPGAGFGL